MFYKAFHLCHGVRDLNLFDPCCFSGVCKGVARGVSRLPRNTTPPSKKYIRNFIPPPKPTPGRNLKLLGPPPPGVTQLCLLSKICVALCRDGKCRDGKMLHFYSKSSKIFQGMKYTFICTLDAKSIKFNVWHQQLMSKTIL